MTPLPPLSLFFPRLPSLEARVRALAAALAARDWALECSPLSRAAVAQAYCRGRAVVGLCPPAILIRSLPLGGKHRDPPVLALAFSSSPSPSPSDEEGREKKEAWLSHILVLLGSHRGARLLAEDIRRCAGGEILAFSLSEQRLGFALDEPPRGWSLQGQSADALEQAMKALARGAPYSVSGEAREGFPPPQFFQNASSPHEQPKSRSLVRFTISNQRSSAGNAWEEIRCVPRTLVAGIGCVRGVSARVLAQGLEASLAEEGLCRSALGAVASVSLKSGEGGLLQLAEEWDLPLRFFDAARLRQESEARGLAGSSVVEAAVGTPNVAEAAALCLAGAGSVLRARKRKFAGATCAIAESRSVLLPEHLAGSACGRLTLVGLGPGGAGQRTFEAAQALREAEALFGYQLYLDLLEAGETSPSAVRHAFPLGAEEARSRAAIACARRGQKVALLGSGDAGIYGLATLVWQILDEEREAPPLYVVQASGVSAMQSLAARVGAPLGDDFCAISLSDIMTTQEQILKRLTCAAKGDFVVALYNPQSARRKTLLEQALKIFRRERPPSTAVACGRNLGREGEQVSIGTLQDFGTKGVDMLSIILIGSSRTKRFDSPSGVRLYTHRGYRLTPEEEVL